MLSGKKYKIVYGFQEPEYIPIDENELVKALYAFMQGSKALFNNGAIRGQDIMRIVPDWHAVKGWNRGYKMLPEDYEDIKPLEKKYQESYGQAKLLAEIAVKENRPELLNQPFEEALKLLPPQNKQISEEVKKLTDKFQV